MRYLVINGTAIFLVVLAGIGCVLWLHGNLPAVNTWRDWYFALSGLGVGVLIVAGVNLVITEPQR